MHLLITLQFHLTEMQISLVLMTHFLCFLLTALAIGKLTDKLVCPSLPLSLPPPSLPLPSPPSSPPPSLPFSPSLPRSLTLSFPPSLPPSLPLPPFFLPPCQNITVLLVSHAGPSVVPLHWTIHCWSRIFLHRTYPINLPEVYILLYNAHKELTHQYPNTQCINHCCSFNAATYG